MAKSQQTDKLKTISYKKVFVFFFRLLLLGGLLFVLYQQIINQDNLLEIKNYYNSGLKERQFIFLVITLLLVFANWGIEAFKWQKVIAKVQSISIWFSIKAILIGVALSMLTPNRIGEYGGRVLLLSEKKAASFVATLVGSLSQIVANICLGGIGMILYALFYWQVEIGFKVLSIASILMICIIVVVVFFNSRWLLKLLSTGKRFEKIKKEIRVVESFVFSDLVELLKVSSLRYLVYCIQYLCLLLFFGGELNVFAALIIIASIFFAQTIIPTIALVELGVRGNVALFFFKPFSVLSIVVLSTTFGLWLINLIIPAIIGGLLTLKTKGLAK